MSMSTHVIGFKPPDDKWKKMKAVRDTCIKAGVSIPEEVEDFFGEGEPSPKGVTVELEDTDCCVKWSDNEEDGFEIDLGKIPVGVTIIRFYNSY